MNDKDFAVGSVLWIGGLTTLKKLTHHESPLPAILASFMLGFVILSASKVDEDATRALVKIACVTAFLINGDAIIALMNGVTKMNAPKPNSRGGVGNVPYGPHAYGSLN